MDNALDAGAERVWIELGRRGVTVADDGRGYHVYGGLMTRRSVVYNRAFIGHAYRAPVTTARGWSS